MIVSSEYLTKALTIAEKIEVIANNQKLNNTNNQSLNQWRTRKNILSDIQFVASLKILNYDVDLFSQAIGDSSEHVEEFVEKLNSSTWYKIYKESFDYTEDLLKYDENVNLAYYLRNYMMYFEKKIITFFANNSKSIDNNLLCELKKNLSTLLLTTSQKTLIYELNLARASRVLDGNSASDRFHCFCSQALKRDNVFEFQEKYPVLIRLLATSTHNYLDMIKTFFLRFEKCRNLIFEKFAIPTEVCISHLDFDMGDQHAHGKTVAKITFTNGTILLYKPKNIELVKAYNQIIEWINSNHDFRLLKMKSLNGLYYEDFAFEEYISAKSCKTDMEIKFFYESFGQLLGIMHALQGGDFHMENLIAHGKHPVIVDLETLIQQFRPFSEADATAIYEVSKILSNSVLGTCLLPENMTNLNIDLSALAGDTQKLDKKVEQVIDTELDTMRIEKMEAFVSSAQNIATLLEKKVGYEAYAEDIIKGFENIYSVFLKNKNKLLELFSAFEHMMVRVLIRDTSNYAKLLDMTLHPNYMKNWLDREHILMNVFSYPIKDLEVCKYEYYDLMYGDIPIFFNYINSRNLLSSDYSVIRNYFTNTSYFEVKTKITELSVEQCEFQKNLIETKVRSKNSLKKIQKIEGNINDLHFSILSDKNKSNSMVESMKIGDMILSKAIVVNNEVSFLTFNLDDFDLEAINLSLDKGLSGMGIYFLYLYKATKIEKYKDFYQLILDTLMNKKYNSIEKTKILHENYAKLYFLYHICLNSISVNNYLLNINKTIAEIDNIAESLTKEDWVNAMPYVTFIILELYNYTKNNDYLIKAITFTEHLKNIISNDTNFLPPCHLVDLLFLKLSEVLKEKEYSKIGNSLLERRIFNENYDYHRIIELGLMINFEKSIVNKSIVEKKIESIEKHFDFLPLYNDDTLYKGNLGKLELYLILKDTPFKHLESIGLISNYVLNKRVGHYKFKKLKGIYNYGMMEGITGVGYQLLRISDPKNTPPILFMR